VRSSMIDAERYLALLGKTINGVLATPGRQVQSVALSQSKGLHKAAKKSERPRWNGGRARAEC